MTTTGIKYTKVNGINIVDAMTASANATTYGRKADKADSTVWLQTVATVCSSFDFGGVPLKTDKESIADLRNALHAHTASCITVALGGAIPETGKDRDGKTFKIKTNDGKVKWSTWSDTRRIFAYLGDIAKVYMYGHKSTLWPEDDTVAARCDILAMCVEEKPLMTKIRQAHKNLQEQLDSVDAPKDAQEAQDLIDTLAVNNVDMTVMLSNMMNRLDALLSIAEDADKDSVRTAMIGIVVKHFEGK